MPQIRNRTTLLLGTANANVIAGSAYEFVGRPSRVQVWVVGSAQGLIAQVQFGPELQFELGTVPEEAAPDRGPLTDDVPLADDIASAGDRIVVRVENPTAGNIDEEHIVRITPVA
ncbi:MAG: hypothetical protein V3T07_09755 [Myxococcota bacterium]